MRFIPQLACSCVLGKNNTARGPVTYQPARLELGVCGVGMGKAKWSTNGVKCPPITSTPLPTSASDLYMVLVHGSLVMVFIVGNFVSIFCYRNMHFFFDIDLVDEPRGMSVTF